MLSPLAPGVVAAPSVSSALVAQGSLVTDQLWWHVARSGGIVALVLTGLAVIWGLLLSSKLLQGDPSPKWLLSLHRYLGSLSVIFTGVHIAGLVADSYLHFGWAEILVPFACSWRPGAVALGVVAMYLLIAVQLTSVFMRRLPRRWWKLIHLSSYGLFWTGLVHGVMAGSDAGNRLYIAVTGLLTMAVVFLTGFRVLTARRKGHQAGQSGGIGQSGENGSPTRGQKPSVSPATTTVG